MQTYDFIALGGGTGGLSASRAARREGGRVALISDAPLGGDCTFTGCIPSKALIEAARQGLDFDAAMTRLHDVVAHIAATENADVLRSEGIDVIEGRGVFTGERQLEVDGQTLTAGAISISTGARAVVPPIPGLSDVAYLTNHELFDLSARPASLGIIGGGPIGCEMAQAFSRFGTNVTIFELANRVLGREEPAASSVIAGALEQSGVTLHLGAAVTRVAAASGSAGIEVYTADGNRTVVEQLLIASGRQANTENLGLDVAGVKLNSKGFIAASDDLATSADGIWAVGDVNGKSPFTHAADEMGRIAVFNAIKGGALKRGKRSAANSQSLKKVNFNPQWIPRVTFTDPEVASVGVAEADAPAGARVAELPMHANDRALTADRTAGYIKLIAGPRRLLRNAGGGQIIGATIVGDRAGELIHEPTLAMRTHMFTGRLAQTTHAYPSWSTGVQKAAAMFFVEIEGRSARPARS